MHRPARGWLNVSVLKEVRRPHGTSLQEPLRNLMIFNITHSITIMSDGSVKFRKFPIEGTQPNLNTIDEYVH
jgi:hypothetical protein